MSVYREGVLGLEFLSEIQDLFNGTPAKKQGESSCADVTLPGKQLPLFEADFRDIKGHTFLRRGLEVAAAGGHHLFLFGPPGSGKTMAASRLPSILPDLSLDEAVEVTRIHSLSGKLDSSTGLLTRPPLRMPHHTASREGIIGGGRDQLPGEISLAHRGILFLDEAPEFSASLLQSLREPLERGRIDIARSDIHYWYPARFQLVMAANPCPCGNLGKKNNSCICSIVEIQKYWKKVGGALMDRIDVRIPVRSVTADTLIKGEGESSSVIRRRVERTAEVQKVRYKGQPYSRNAEIPVSSLLKYCTLSDRGRDAFTTATEKLGLSSRACHSVLRLGRTIADMEGKFLIEKEHVYEAVQHRRYGDGDYFWKR